MSRTDEQMMREIVAIIRRSKREYQRNLDAGRAKGVLTLTWLNIGAINACDDLLTALKRKKGTP
jgi:hypothetical protein